jgi:steroid delta-isomerase-like uncharacterized protein
VLTPSELHRQFVASWNSRDFKTFRSLLHSDYSYTSSSGHMLHGPDAGVDAAQLLMGAFPDAQTEVASLHTYGNLSFGEFVTKGTHTGPLNSIPASGRLVTALRCNVIEVRDGLIYREREYMDMLSVLVQIGAVNPPGDQT